MAGETVALTEAFDHIFIIKHDLQRMLGKQVALLMIKDSKLLFDVIPGNRYTTEARLKVDIAAVREGYNQKIISSIALISKHYNLDDPLTNIKGNSSLDVFLRTHRVQHPIEQHVVEPKLNIGWGC